MSTPPGVPDDLAAQPDTAAHTEPPPGVPRDIAEHAGAESFSTRPIGVPDDLGSVPEGYGEERYAEEPPAVDPTSNPPDRVASEPRVGSDGDDRLSTGGDDPPAGTAPRSDTPRDVSPRDVPPREPRNARVDADDDSSTHQ